MSPSSPTPTGSSTWRTRASRTTCCRRARSTRTATSSARATSFPTRRNGSTPRSTRPRRSCSRCTTSSASSAASSCRPPVTARTTAPWWTRCGPPGTGPAAWRRSGRRQPGRTGRDARGRRPRCPLQLRQAPRRSQAGRLLPWPGRPHRRVRLAHRHLLRGARTWPSAGTCSPRLPTTIVVDHMGRPDVTQPLDGAGFALFQRLMREHENVWAKLSGAERLTKSGPPGYDDFIPFARHIAQAFPDRVIWGTDWPHPNMKSSHARRGRPGRPAAADRAHRGPAAQAARRQPDAPVLAEEK